MCGITGYQGNKPGELLSKMVDAMSHRGPDNQQCERLDEDMIGLGHVRLSIIDLSESSNQPLWNVSHTHCVCFNGEIYNYKSLREELIRSGCRFNSDGDAEVLVNLYAKYGVEAFSKLNGIYAFVIWDSILKELVVVRDPLGVKPLYYCENENGFTFASELKSLLQDESISRDLDRTALSHYLRNLWCPMPLTPLKAVKKLEPGSRSNGKVGRITD